jgi:ankyrin repeat protein
MSDPHTEEEAPPAGATEVEVLGGDVPRGPYRLDAARGLLTGPAGEIPLAGSIRRLTPLPPRRLDLLAGAARNGWTRGGAAAAAAALLAALRPGAETPAFACRLQDGRRFRARIAGPAAAEVWFEIQSLAYGLSSPRPPPAASESQKDAPAEAAPQAASPAAQAPQENRAATAPPVQRPAAPAADRDATRPPPSAAPAAAALPKEPAADRPPPDAAPADDLTADDPTADAEADAGERPADVEAFFRRQSWFGLAPPPSAPASDGSGSAPGTRGRGTEEAPDAGAAEPPGAQPPSPAPSAEGDPSALLAEARAAEEAGRTAEAFELYLMAANAGCGEASLQLGWLALSDRGGQPDRDRAAAFFQKARRQSEPRGAAELGFLRLEDGREAAAEALFDEYFTATRDHPRRPARLTVAERYFRDRAARGLPLAHRRPVIDAAPDAQRRRWKRLLDAEDRGGALPLAAEAADEEFLRECLDAGADPNRAQPDGRTPLHLLAAASPAEAEEDARRCAEALHRTGAALDACDREGRTPLHLAAGAARPALAEWLLIHGAPPDAVDDEGCTPLHHTLRRLRQAPATEGALPPLVGALRALLHHGADPDRPDPAGPTPLQQAVLDLRPDLVELLLDGGAAAHGPEAGGCPLQLLLLRHCQAPPAAEATLRRCIARLVEHGASANARLAAGLTPLHLAVARRDRDLAAALLAAGADANRAGHQGLTPLDLLRAEGTEPQPAEAALRRLLEAHGADETKTYRAGLDARRARGAEVTDDLAEKTAALHRQLEEWLTDSAPARQAGAFRAQDAPAEAGS